MKSAAPRPSPISSPAEQPRRQEGGPAGRPRGGVEVEGGGQGAVQVHGVGTHPHDTGPHTTRGASVVCFGMTLELVRHMSRHRVMSRHVARH